MTNVEIKTRYTKTRRTETILKKIGAHFDRVEAQKDTYFAVNSGMLKIRERDSDLPQLIQYFRGDEKAPRPSYYEIIHLRNVEKVRETLEREHGILGVIVKEREIWLWENVRIHFDKVEKLGEFLEFEAVLEYDSDVEEESKKVRWLMKKFKIQEKNLLKESYIDFITHHC
jgi:adenylate cyclase class 2